MIYVVTGTSRGIGLELVTQLLARGDHVVATARKPDESSGLQELAKAHKDSLKIVQMAVQDAESIKARGAFMCHVALLCRRSLKLYVCADAFNRMYRAGCSQHHRRRISQRCRRSH